jgi:hypothetical protein
MRRTIQSHLPNCKVKLDVAHWDFRVLENCISSHPGYRSLATALKEVMFGIAGRQDAYLWKSQEELSKKLYSTMEEYCTRYPGLFTEAAVVEWNKQIKLHVLSVNNCMSMEGIARRVETIDGVGKSPQGTSSMEGGNMQIRRVSGID